MGIRRHDFWQGLRERYVEDEHGGAFGASGALKLHTGLQAPYTLFETFTDGWDFQQVTETMTGAEYYKLWVLDETGGRTIALRTATVFQIGNVLYKKLAPDPPIRNGNIWEMKLQPVGVVAVASQSPSASRSPSASASPSRSPSASASPSP